MDAIILQILNGLDKGSAYALIALGLTLIFGTLGVVNFAHGALFMIGAFCAVTLSRILTLSHTVIDETQKDFLLEFELLVDHLHDKIGAGDFVDVGRDLDTAEKGFLLAFGHAPALDLAIHVFSESVEAALSFFFVFFDNEDV